MTKRKRNDAIGSSRCKKSKVPISLCALRQCVGLMPIAGCLSTAQDVSLAPPVIEAPTAATSTPTTLGPSPPRAVIVQEDTLVVPATQADSAMALSSIITHHRDTFIKCWSG